MRFLYQSKELLFIPSVIYINKNHIQISLHKNIDVKMKDILYNVDNVNDIKLVLNFNSSSLNIINNYIYKYHIIKNNNSYNLSKNKITTSLTTFSKTLNSIWFLNNL